MRKKMQLLTAVAASALFATAAFAAENSDQKSKSEMSNPAPAAQQKAPAEKVSPSMHAGQPKAETTGQATKSDEKAKTELKASDSNKAGMKSESAKPETTGQAPKASESKSDMTKSDMSKSATDSGNATKSGASQKSTESSSKASTTGQGAAAAGAANLSTEQRTKITSIIKKQHVQRTSLNISVHVGASVPASVHFYPLPTEVVEVYPEWRGYDFILVGDQIIVINPRSHVIVAVLEA